MADTIKCPNCGSNLTLNADTQKLDCAFCGASFNPSSIESVVEELEKKKLASDGAQEAQATPAAQQTAAQQDQQTAEQQVQQPGGPAPEQTEFVCNACGAKIVTDSHTAATFCAFCGSPALVG
ncbi:MAG: hypothetical protein IKH20_09905 [Clostridiales bacterium]|nr:hypothetical protein [Clostridiales bacterium]